MRIKVDEAFLYALMKGFVIYINIGDHSVDTILHWAILVFSIISISTVTCNFHSDLPTLHSHFVSPIETQFYLKLVNVPSLVINYD